MQRTQAENVIAAALFIAVCFESCTTIFASFSKDTLNNIQSVSKSLQHSGQSLTHACKSKERCQKRDEEHLLNSSVFHCQWDILQD